MANGDRPHEDVRILGLADGLAKGTCISWAIGILALETGEVAGAAVLVSGNEGTGFDGTEWEYAATSVRRVDDTKFVPFTVRVAAFGQRMLT